MIYDQIREDTLYMMLYAAVTMLSLMTCCYLLFRQGNAFAKDITPPVRLRRWTAVFFAATTLCHIWYLPTYFLTSPDDMMLGCLIARLLDSMTVIPLTIVVLLVMLQDRRRPLWPVAESGSVNQTRSPEEGIECTNKLMEVLGCKTVADLLKVDGDKLLEASSVLFVHQVPERDGKILPTDTFEAYANGAAKDLEILVGCNKDEMNFFVSSFGKEGWDNFIAGRKQEKFAQLPADEKALVESYMKDVKGDYFQPDSSLFSQSWFIAPIIRISEEQTKGGGKCYTYYFTPESPDPIMKCGHAIELSVVFNHPEFTADTGRSFDETFCKTMRKMWVQFAKTGNPSLSADISPDGKAKEWPLYDLEDKRVMVLDEFDIHPAKESEVKIVDWERTYFLTKYYML